MMNFLRKQMKWVMAIIVLAFLLSTFLMYEGRGTRRTPGRNPDGSMSDYEVAQINGRSLMRSELERRLSTLEERHKASKERLLKMYKDKLDGLLSDEDYAMFRQSLSDEENALAEQAAEVSKQITDCRKRQENAKGQKALVEQYTHFDKLDRTVADEFIDFIEIGMTDDNAEREIHIHWKI